MSQQASKTQLNKFVEVVDKFMRDYARLKSDAVAKQVYATNNPALIADYENTVVRGGQIRGSIIAVTGAWDAAKRQYAKVTGVTSMAIGDAIDEIRSWFGYDAAGGIGNYHGGGLGAFQIPAAALGAAWIAGILAAIAAFYGMYNKLMITLEASRIQKENPDIPRAAALEQAKQGLESDGLFGSGMSLGMFGALAVGAYFLLNRK